MRQNGFVFDPNRCTGCQACELACTVENALPFGFSWRKVKTYNTTHHPGIPLFHLSLACNHCGEAPCLKHCPAGAISRDQATGAVQLETDRCMGCGYCLWVCPFDAPKFDEKRGVMTKCTGCPSRVEQGLSPACSAGCPTSALGYQALEEEERSQGTPGFPRTDAAPRIRILPLDEKRRRPDLSSPAGTKGFDAEAGLPRGAIRLRTEWPLALFTFLAALLSAAALSHAAAGFRLPTSVFFIAGFAGLLLSVLHLGRKARAPRAGWNVKRSWLSREVLFYIGFFWLFGFHLTGLLESPFFSWTAVALALASLFSIDRVYDPLAGSGRGGLHSAGALLTGLFLAGVFMDQTILAFPLGLAKAGLYVARKRSGRRLRPIWSLIRLGCGIAIPLVLLVTEDRLLPLAMVLVVLGEAIDRCEFYEELEIRNTDRTLAADLKREVRSLA